MSNSMVGRSSIIHQLTVLLVLAATCAARGAGGYLPARGPTPLRFIDATPPAHTFVWPPLVPAISVSPQPATVSPATNSPPAPAAIIPAAPEPAASLTTNTTAEVPALIPSPIPETVSNQGPALPALQSPLVTPQMLAEFFTSILTGNNQSATNFPANGSVLFLPPMPKISGNSEAIYRTQ